MMFSREVEIKNSEFISIVLLLSNTTYCYQSRHSVDQCRQHKLLEKFVINKRHSTASVEADYNGIIV